MSKLMAVIVIAMLVFAFREELEFLVRTNPFVIVFAFFGLLLALLVSNELGGTKYHHRR